MKKYISTPDNKLVIYRKLEVITLNDREREEKEFEEKFFGNIEKILKVLEEEREQEKTRESEKMSIRFIRNDITKMHVDAIVNAANSSLLGGGGVDGSIHRAAGPKLLEECRTLGGCETGNAKITGAGNLPCKYVIHAVGPRWYGGNHREPEHLASCYRTSLELAKEKDCKTVAFPLISAGIYGYPKEQAMQIAVDTVRDFLKENTGMTVYIVLFGEDVYQISREKFPEIVEEKSK